MLKKLINLFKKKEITHILQVYEKPEIFSIDEQIDWIMKDCPNHQFKSNKEFNIFAYGVITSLVLDIINPIGYDKESITVNVSKGCDINIWTHENGCSSYYLYSHVSVETNIEVLKKFINVINTNYKCLNLQESTSQSK